MAFLGMQYWSLHARICCEAVNAERMQRLIVGSAIVSNAINQTYPQLWTPSLALYKSEHVLARRIILRIRRVD